MILPSTGRAISSMLSSASNIFRQMQEKCLLELWPAKKHRASLLTNQSMKRDPFRIKKKKLTGSQTSGSP